MIYAPITSFLPLPSPAYRGYGHARAKNILAKCDSRVSLSSSTDVVEAIKSEPEAASRGLKRTALSILLIDPDSLLHPKKKREKDSLFAEKVCLKNRESGCYCPPSSFLPPLSLYDVLEKCTRREKWTKVHNISSPSRSFHFEATFSVQIALSS